ncbi:hypothetical protein LSH36_2020g00002 [Paralvinella palmiformis]|uniref:Uncharacterized protein n=1 Tax=Paralvinella palmiformis TaxID=53620 RepID=A0AAD9ML59_9ANNE|nr:hypothetical protein LSH36_2020g00002 [Paralvinella palmiformis]
MLYVELYTGNLFSVCDAPAGKSRKSAVFSEYKTVSLSLLKTILTDKKEQLSINIQSNLTLVESSDGSINDIIIVVSCVGVIVAVAIITTIPVVLLRGSRR